MRAALIEDGVVVNVVVVDALNVIEGLLVESDIASVGDTWDGSTFHSPEFDPPPPTREELKRQRQMAVNAITVTVNGMVFDGDETSQERMSRALKVAEITGIESCTWVLHDNTTAEVTQADLAEALSLSMQAQGAIWVLPYETP